MDTAMSDDMTLSPLRRVLCSHANAVRVAGRMIADGLATRVIAIDDPLQPWRAVEAHEAEDRRSRACA